jgi:hypothetical protein
MTASVRPDANPIVAVRSPACAGTGASWAPINIDAIKASVVARRVGMGVLSS